MMSHKVDKNQKPTASGMSDCEPGPSGPSKKLYREVETFRPADEEGSAGVGSEKEIDEVTRFNRQSPDGGKEIDEVTRFNRQSPDGGKEIDEVATFRVQPSGGEKEIDEVTRFNRQPSEGGSKRSMKEIEEVATFRKVNCKCGKGNEMVSCPACDSEIHGMDEKELSNNLGRHLSEAHQMKIMIAPMR